MVFEIELRAEWEIYGQKFQDVVFFGKRGQPKHKMFTAKKKTICTR